MAATLRSSWPTPQIVDRGAIDHFFPRSPSLKHITIGKERMCKGFGTCIERDFSLDLYAPDRAGHLTDELRNTATIKTVETWSTGGVSYRRYRERGENCETEGMLAIGSRYVYRLIYACADKKSATYSDWIRILRTWTVYPTSDERSRR
jgi:hypothetical protein